MVLEKFIIEFMFMLLHSHKIELNFNVLIFCIKMYVYVLCLRVYFLLPSHQVHWVCGGSQLGF